MFQTRQYEEINPLVEVSRCVATPGAITTGTTVNVATAVCTVGAQGVGTSPATFALGDQLEVFPSAAAATNGIIVQAAPTATPGTCTLSFANPTGGSITPTAGAVYTIIATRINAGTI